MSAEPKLRYPEIDQELATLLGRDKSELSFMYHFNRVELLIMRKVGDRELAKEMLNDLELFRQGLLKEIQEMRSMVSQSRPHPAG